LKISGGVRVDHITFKEGGKENWWGGGRTSILYSSRGRKSHAGRFVVQAVCWVKRSKKKRHFDGKTFGGSGEGTDGALHFREQEVRPEGKFKKPACSVT